MMNTILQNAFPNVEKSLLWTKFPIFFAILLKHIFSIVKNTFDVIELMSLKDAQIKIMISYLLMF